jgi:predicted nucleic acid-binding protein
VTRVRPVVALYDANVLYPASLRDLLIRLARTGIVSARWTAQIQDEWIRNLLKKRPDLAPSQLQRTRELMEAAVPGAVVDGFEHHIPRLVLPDADDRHVLAAAIETRADVIVTFNTRDFPEDVTAQYRIRIRVTDPDTFVLELLSAHPAEVHAAARAQRANLRNPPRSVDEYLSDLEIGGLPRTAAALRLPSLDL